MATEKFEDRSLSGPIKITLDPGKIWTANKEDIIEHMRDIVDRYMATGYTLTLRQMYYQLVAGGHIPNHIKVYAKISSIKDDCCYSGEIDWEAFEDRGRVPHLPYTVNGIKDALDKLNGYYMLNRQDGQNVHVEMWTEKDAISGILKRVTESYCVRLCVNKGYSSSSAIYNAYERFAESINKDIPVVILYLGDHDPSGLDMIRDIRERILFMLQKGDQLGTFGVTRWQNQVLSGELDTDEGEFIEREYPGELYDEMLDEYGDLDWEKAYFHYFFKVKPIGLTMEQIRRYNPPENPAKITDPRAAWYIKNLGTKSWEVDALRPEILTALVRDSISAEIDVAKLEEVIRRERDEKKELKAFGDKY